MIEDKIKVLPLKDIKNVPVFSRENIVRILLDNREAIENTFVDNEYIKIDLTHGEIIGLASTAHFGKMHIGNLPAMDYVIKHDEKYKDAHILNLGNINTLFLYHGGES
jgi:hypothetical protein